MKDEICELPHLTPEEEHECEIRNIAKKLYRACYEAEHETWVYPYRDYISFEGVSPEIQSVFISVVKKLIDRGVITVER